MDVKPGLRKNPLMSKLEQILNYYKQWKY
jgi:hypothetical protein